MQPKNKLIDPVCGREVTENSQYRSYYGNGYYYFCSAKDKEDFDKQPEKYVKDQATMVPGSCDD
jgi:YHS domain-containing protein